MRTLRVRRHPRGVALLGLAGVAVSVGCLPADTRPVPSTVSVSAQPSDETVRGLTTADGWTVTFDRFVTSLGDVRLDAPEGRSEGACNAYYETHYEWLFDFVQAGREKVGVVYGLGSCSVSYRFRGPGSDAVLGTGATQADLDAMSVEATDAYADESRTTLVARGVATRGAERKSFEWRFRRGYRMDRCPSATGDGSLSELELESEGEYTLGVEVRGQELFRRGTEDADPLQFELYAAADADGDGEVTMDELAATDAPAELQSSGTGAGGGTSGGEDEPIVTLADLVNIALLPRVTRLKGGGACEAEVRNRR